MNCKGKFGNLTCISDRRKEEELRTIETTMSTDKAVQSTWLWFNLSLESLKRSPEQDLITDSKSIYFSAFWGTLSSGPLIITTIFTFKQGGGRSHGN